MKIHKRIKQIVSLTVDDFYSSGYSSSDTPQGLKDWLVEDILKIDDIEDLYTYQISILILEKLKALDIVDLGFIIELVCDTKKSSDISITFDKVVL
jgi:hypothetical protein